MCINKLVILSIVERNRNEFFFKNRMCVQSKIRKEKSRKCKQLQASLRTEIEKIK